MGGGQKYPMKNDLLPTPTSTLSYWRTEPHRLDEFRSSEQLPPACDIAIIGAGFSGAATAYNLTQQYASSQKPLPSIVILEARQACSGATGRNGGHLKMQPSFLADRVRTMGRKNVQIFHSFIQTQIASVKEVIDKEGIDCESELRRSYDVMLDEEEARQAEKDLQWLRDQDFKGIDLLDHVQEKFAPMVTGLKDAKGAISTQALSLWPYKLVTSLLEIVVNRGVQLHCNNPVDSVVNEGGINHLSTSRGTMQAKVVVFASNAYTAGLLPQYRGFITPTKSTASHISVPADSPSPPPYLGTTYNIRFEPDRVDYMNPRPDGSIVVGGAQWTYRDDKSLWYNRVDDDTQIPGAKAHFDGLMQRHFRGWENSGAFTEHVWTGIQGVTPDGMPHVGLIPHTSNQYILAGYNGGGNGLIFGCALGVARMIVHGIPFEESGIPIVFKTGFEDVRKLDHRLVERGGWWYKESSIARAIRACPRPDMGSF